MKTLVLFIMGAPSGRHVREVTIQPGVTPADIKRSIELPQDVSLLLMDSGVLLDDSRDLYSVVTDFAKLWAVPPCRFD